MAKINANYEAVYILQPDLSEEQIAALVAKGYGIYILFTNGALTITWRKTIIISYIGRRTRLPPVS